MKNKGIHIYVIYCEAVLEEGIFWNNLVRLHIRELCISFTSYMFYVIHASIYLGLMFNNPGDASLIDCVLDCYLELKLWLTKLIDWWINWLYCRLLSLDISGSGIQYNPGDIALVQPENLEDNVEFFFSLFPDLGLTLLLGTINDNLSGV